MFRFTRLLLAVTVFWLGYLPPRTVAQTAPPPAAASENQTLSVAIKAARRVLKPDEAMRVEVIIKNRGQLPVTLNRVTAGNKTEVASLAGRVIAPGETVRWKGETELTMAQGAEYGLGAAMLSVESSAGSFTASQQVRRLPLFEMKAEFDPRPVFGSAEYQNGDARSLKVILLSRLPGEQEVKVDVTVPPAFRLVEGRAADTRVLRQGERKQITYKFLVPLNAEIGQYTVVATVTVGGRTYTESGIIAVTR